MGDARKPDERFVDVSKPVTDVQPARNHQAVLSELEWIGGDCKIRLSGHVSQFDPGRDQCNASAEGQLARLTSVKGPLTRRTVGCSIGRLDSSMDRLPDPWHPCFSTRRRRCSPDSTAN